MAQTVLPAPAEAEIQIGPKAAGMSTALVGMWGLAFQAQNHRCILKELHPLPS